jgi:LPS-assembly lipoprotein
MSASCGFHLRENIVLPDIYQKILVVDKGANDITTLLKQSLLENNVQLVNSAQLASSIIIINSQNIHRRALAVRGKEVKEYEVQLNVSLSIQDPNGKQLGESQNISTQRRYSYNNNQVLGSNNEEQILIKEMKADINRQILWRLSKIK